MEKYIEQSLIKASYSKMSVNIRDISIFFLDDKTSAQVVVLFKEEELFFNQWKAILGQIDSKLKKRGYEEIHIHSIVYQKQSGIMREITEAIPSYWLINMQEKKLIIYENQPSDFYGIRAVIESALQGTDSINANSIHTMGNRNKKKTSNKLFAKGIKLRLNFMWRRYPIITWLLVLINVIIFLIIESTGSTQDTDYMLQWGAMYIPYVLENGEIYRLVTHTFLHFGIEHLLNNMLLLFLLGEYVERYVGKIRYLVIYFGTGILAGAISMQYNIITGEMPVSAGASGAIFGVIGALLFLIILYKGKLEGLSIERMLIFIFLSFYSGIAQIDIDNAAHLGGFVCGIIVTAIVYPYRKFRKGRVGW